MYFHLRVKKALQAAGVLFRSDAVRTMNYMRLLKLLYIADREALRETGRPITGGQVVAMEQGPVLEEVYDLIRGQHVDMPVWEEYFRKNRYNLDLIKEPDVKLLSRYEITKLQEIAKRHEEDDEWVLSKKTHEFSEWKKNDPGKSSRPIPLKDMLEGIGRGESAETIQADASDTTFFDRVFGI